MFLCFILKIDIDIKCLLLLHICCVIISTKLSWASIIIEFIGVVCHLSFFSKKWSHYRFTNPITIKINLRKPNTNHKIRCRIYSFHYPDKNAAQTPNKWFHTTCFRPQRVLSSNIPHPNLTKNHNHDQIHHISAPSLIFPAQICFKPYFPPGDQA